MTGYDHGQNFGTGYNFGTVSPVRTVTTANPGFGAKFKIATVSFSMSVSQGEPQARRHRGREHGQPAALVQRAARDPRERRSGPRAGVSSTAGAFWQS